MLGDVQLAYQQVSDKIRLNIWKGRYDIITTIFIIRYIFGDDKICSAKVVIFTVP